MYDYLLEPDAPSKSDTYRYALDDVLYSLQKLIHKIDGDEVSSLDILEELEDQTAYISQILEN